MFKLDKYIHTYPNLPGALSHCLRFTTHFDRTAVPSICSELAPYTKGVHHLSTKQVPTALAIKEPGSSSVNKKISVLLEEGFPLVAKKLRKGDEEIDESLYFFSTILQGEHKIAKLENSSVNPLGTPDDNYFQLPLEEDEQRLINKQFYAKIDYEDPFRVIAGRALVRSQGIEPLSIGLRTKVWFGDQYRLTEPFPGKFLPKEYTGKRDRKIKFVDLSNLEVKKDFLYKQTYWGSKLNQLMRPGDLEGLFPTDSVQARKQIQTWAVNLKKKISDFLGCKPNPSWKKGLVEALFDSYQPSQKARSKRLLEVLKTVDGIFLQRYSSFPEEIWTWNKFDIFVLKHLDILLDDEFLDCDLNQVDITSRYEELKQCRKLFKKYANRDQLTRKLELGEINSEIPKWLHSFLPIWARAMKQDNDRKDYLNGVLSQTRGCGTPPPIVILKTKVKFIETITLAPRPPTLTQRKVVLCVLEKTLAEIPDEVFTGLTTKARISLTTSGCWEKTAKEGGTLQAITELVNLGRSGRPVKILDLFTGIELYERSIEDLSVGEYIFWSCLEEVLRTNPVELRRAFLLVVKEPSKGRSVTKASAYLKVVLDTISKLCAWPLGKGFKSSKSGMLASSHGWNFFLQFFDQDEEEMSFDPLYETELRMNTESMLLQQTFRDVFIGSTDFETATDYMEHWLGKDIAHAWMKKCGIPPVLQKIVFRTSFEPREIHFVGRGYLSRYGELVNEAESIRKVTLLRGVLMGDPLTKIILHMVNILIRKTAGLLGDNSFIEEIWPGGTDSYKEIFKEQVNAKWETKKTQQGKIGADGFLEPNPPKGKGKSPQAKRDKTPKGAWNETGPGQVLARDVYEASRSLSLRLKLREIRDSEGIEGIFPPPGVSQESRSVIPIKVHLPESHEGT